MRPPPVFADASVHFTLAWLSGERDVYGAADDSDRTRFRPPAERPSDFN